MKLNVDIILDNLSQFVKLECYGLKKSKLSLRRPEFYNGDSCNFERNRIYLTSFDRLTADPIFEDGVVIIIVGGDPPISYLEDKCVCISIKDSNNLLTISNLVHQIFDRYDEWDAALQSIINTTGSIKELIELSFPIFENPIFVLDDKFRFLAYSGIIDTEDELANYRPNKNGSLDIDRFTTFMNNFGMNASMIEPFLVTSNDVQYFIINLFNKKKYAGSLTIPFILRRHRQSDSALAQYLAKVIECSLDKFVKMVNTHTNILRSVFQNLLSGLPIDSNRMQYLKDNKISGQYVCVKVILGYPSQKVVSEYICTNIESNFSGCVAFEFESSVVAFIDINKISCDEKTLIGKVQKLLQLLNFKAGVSYSFTDLTMARLYYRQACVAFEMGFAINPDISYYLFHDSTLSYMILNSMGEFPPELLLTKGVSLLLDHDTDAQTNYVYTLRTYLNNSMNITKTAKDLFIHRSTFLDRLKRINKLLQIDLDDPDQRLRLLISLKVLEYNEFITGKLKNIEFLNDNDLNLEELKKILVVDSIYIENPNIK